MSNFSRTPVSEVHLELAPLAKVLMQVQFSRTPQLVADEAESVIAERLARYPVRRRQAVGVAEVAFSVNGQQMPFPMPGPPSAFLTFSDASSTWTASVTDTAVSLETTAYTSRDDFCDRALELFAAVASVALPPVVDRVGLRYIDRLLGDSLQELPRFVIPQLCGLYGAVQDDLALVHSVTDSMIDIGPAERLQVKSGVLPGGMAFDPVLPPVGEPSWLLDMDVFTTAAGFPFEPPALAQRLRGYAETAYAFFRFATTEAFQEHHLGSSATTTAIGQR
jgi:uncharacterized protein (TIGR04255 family)